MPFRLTRNITSILGPWLLDGIFAASMTAAAACLARNQDLMKNFLSLFVRDESIMFHASRVTLLTDLEQQRVEQSIRDRVSVNVRQMLKRVHGLMPLSATTATQPDEMPPPVNSKVLKFLEVATDPAFVANMPAVWMPWF